MPAGLTVSATAPRHSSPWWVLRDVALVLAGFAVGGAVCGLWWQWWWTPPTGIVFDHTWYADTEGVQDTFSGTALYVVVAAVGGLVLGTAAAWFCDRAALVTLSAVLAGSVLAAWVMLQVGLATAPPDPQLAAASAPDHTELPGTLQVSGDSPFGAFPAGALAGTAVVFVGLAGGRRSRR